MKIFSLRFINFSFFLVKTHMKALKKRWSRAKCHAELVSASNGINGLRDPETSSG
jgi:hypothetical protein